MRLEPNPLTEKHIFETIIMAFDLFGRSGLFKTDQYRRSKNFDGDAQGI